MRYAEYLKRSMDRLTTDAWERLLTEAPTDRSAPKQIFTSCPCCHTPVTIEVATALLPVLASTASITDPDDSLLHDPADDTHIELAAVTCTDLVLA
jgi:hypothetical protein